MRYCRLSKTDELVKENGLYAQVMGLTDSPNGVQARLKFPNGYRAVVPVQRVRMLQDETVQQSKGSIYDGF
mgnify:CR=1 FL=1